MCLIPALGFSPRFFLSLAVLLGICVGALSCAAGPFTAAGVIAFTRIQDRTYVLLADHPGTDRGWGTFGGHREGEESVAETAAREFREETRCVYDGPAPEDLQDLAVVEYHSYRSVTVEVPYLPSQVFESRLAPAECDGPQYRERGPWIWVPLDALRAVLEAGADAGSYELPEELVPTGTTRKLWSASAEVLRLAMEEGSLR